MRTRSDRDGRRLLVGGLMLWAMSAALFIARSPAGAFTHDLRGHVEHTRILYNEHRLALPREGWETYQPPLYYAIDALLSPNQPGHVFRVRLMSVLYGSLTLLLMSGLLMRCGAPSRVQAFVLLFIATTPAFLFMFSTYNNDSLTTLLSSAILTAAFEYVRRPQRRLLALLAVLATAGLYTKLSVVYLLGALSLVLAYLGVCRRLAWHRILLMYAAFGAAGALLAPWVIGHNYRLTGRFTPVPMDFPLNQEIRLTSTPLQTIVTPPGWTRGEWKDPYIHLWESTDNKKSSFLAYFFVSSIFGEYTFEFLPSLIPWGIVALHGVLWILALVRARLSPWGAPAVGLMVPGALLLTTLIFRQPYANLMDFRYVAWLWLPGAVLYSTALFRPSQPEGIFQGILAVGIFLQALLWAALIVGGRWSFA